jgi:hypothetical protein
VFGYCHMIGRVLEVHTTTTTNSCGLAGIMWNTGIDNDAITGMVMVLMTSTV